MNTAQAHWNQEAMKGYLDGRFDRLRSEHVTAENFSNVL
jgi:hypothetical protein